MGIVIITRDNMLHGIYRLTAEAVDGQSNADVTEKMKRSVHQKSNK